MLEKLRKHRSLLPLLLLALLCQWTLWLVLNGSVTLDPGLIGWAALIPHIAAFIAVIACLAVYFLRRRAYAPVLLITLVLGTFNIFNCTPFESTAYLRMFFVLKFSFQPLVAIVDFVALAQLTMGSKKAGSRDEIYIDAEKLADFKERYLSYSTERLQEIINENRYTPEALEAARQVLQERNELFKPV